jgi:hypothetical protein
MDRYFDNTETAVDPQAIVSAPPMKFPIWDNDPTRGISPLRATNRFLVVELVVVLLLAMMIATAMLLVR